MVLKAKVTDSILAAVDQDRVLTLEQECVRIPSFTYEEQACADYLGRVMDEIGLEVEMMEVEDPMGTGRRGRQPVGRLRGSGGGPSLMLNGHMDHRELVGEWDHDPFSGHFEDGKIYGRGSQDDKGGIVAMVSAVAAICKSGVKLKGDVLVCPVMAHKPGGHGTQALIARGYGTDMCINTENSGNGIAHVSCGLLRFRLHARSPLIHVNSTPAQRACYLNPVEQLALIVQRMGSSIRPIPEGDWMTFERHPDLPEFPKLHYDEIVGDHMSRVTSDEMTMTVQVRTVPGQSAKTIKADVKRLLATLTKDHPNFDVTVQVPPQDGRWAGFEGPALSTPADSKLVTTLARNHEEVTGSPPVMGAEPRMGSYNDGNMLAASGIETVMYGPGNLRVFDAWPTANEYVTLDELMVCTKTLALTIAEICG